MALIGTAAMATIKNQIGMQTRKASSRLASGILSTDRIGIPQTLPHPPRKANPMMNPPCRFRPEQTPKPTLNARAGDL